MCRPLPVCQRRPEVLRLYELLPRPSSQVQESAVLSSESVNEGHSDKLCDQVSDAALNACSKEDPKGKAASEAATKDNTTGEMEKVVERSRLEACAAVQSAEGAACLTKESKSKVSCETATEDHMVTVAGDVTTQAKMNCEKTVRGVAEKTGFDSYDGDLSSVAPMDEPAPMEAKGDRVFSFSSEPVNEGRPDQLSIDKPLESERCKQTADDPTFRGSQIPEIIRMIFAKFTPSRARRQQIAAGAAPGTFELVHNTDPLRAAVEAAAAEKWDAMALVRAKEIEPIFVRTTTALTKLRDLQDRNREKYAVACTLCPNCCRPVHFDVDPWGEWCEYCYHEVRPVVEGQPQCLACRTLLAGPDDLDGWCCSCNREVRPLLWSS